MKSYRVKVLLFLPWTFLVLFCVPFGVSISTQFSSSSHRPNFKKLRLKMGYWGNVNDTFETSCKAVGVFPPHITEMNSRNLLENHMLGYLIDFLNITIDVIGGSSAQNEKLILEEKLDFGFSDNYFLATTAEKFSFSYPHYTSRALIYFNTGAKHDRGGVISEVFSVQVWIAIFLTNLFAAFVIFCTYGWGNAQPSEIFLLVIALNSAQGYTSADKNYRFSRTSKLVLFLFMCQGIIVSAYFSAKLLFTFSAKESNINSIHDMFEAGFRFGINNASYPAQYARKGTNAEQKLRQGSLMHILISNHLDQKLPLGNNVDAIPYIIGRKNYAFISEFDMFEDLDSNWSDTRKCHQMTQIPFPNVMDFGVIAKRGSPYLKYMKYAMTRMMQTGIFRRNFIRKKRFKDEYAPPCAEVVQIPQLQALKLASIHIAFYIHIFGLILGLAIAAAEIYFYKYRKLSENVYLERN